jgi:hypothetical protein
MSRKDTTLYVFWSKKERDFMYAYPTSAADGHLLHYWFSPRFWPSGEERKSLYQELEERGYDTTTLKFSIKKKEVK